MAEARAFQSYPTPDRRRRLIDHLLDQPGYAGTFARFWGSRWLPQGDAQFENLKPQFLDWLRRRLRQNAPYDRMAREVLGAEGGAPGERRGTGGAPRLFLQANEFKPENLAGSVSRVFLGVSLECAQCHDHPSAAWKRTQFWDFAAFFADGLNLTDPGTRRRASPRFLDGTAPAWPADPGRAGGRRALTGWMTDPGNPYFARTAANALWSHFFGRPLADALDDPSAGAAPDLLDVLGREFARHGFDLKYLVRAIALSRAYQLTSAGPAGAPEPRLFARAAVRPLSGDELYDSLLTATGLDEGSLAGPPEYGKPDVPPRQAFLAYFARGDGTAAPPRTILQALFVMNGRLSARAVGVHDGRTLTAVAEAPFLTTGGKVQALYLAALGRPPRPDEREQLVAYVEAGGPHRDGRRALADVFWALLNSSEFGVNH